MLVSGCALRDSNPQLAVPYVHAGGVHTKGPFMPAAVGSETAGPSLGELDRAPQSSQTSGSSPVGPSKAYVRPIH